MACHRLICGDDFFEHGDVSPEGFVGLTNDGRCGYSELSTCEYVDGSLVVLSKSVAHDSMSP